MLRTPAPLIGALGLMFNQSDRIRDYVFPIATAKRNENVYQLVKILGTGFVIGNHGFALTARHVVAAYRSEIKVAMFAANDSGWLCFEIIASEDHPSEDVSVIRLSAGEWKSFFRLANTHEQASCRYRLFGYPDDATYEIVDAGKAIARPDLVYNEGYFRRRYDGDLPGIDGRAFFELSEVAGSGASGAPVFKFSTPAWEVMGVYIGEKLNDRATSVSYAVREDSFRHWQPRILGTSVLNESMNISP